MEIQREARKVCCLLSPRALYSVLRAVCCPLLAQQMRRWRMTRERALGHAGLGPDETAMPWSRYESFPRGWMLGPKCVGPRGSVPSPLYSSCLWIPTHPPNLALGGGGPGEGAAPPPPCSRDLNGCGRHPPRGLELLRNILENYYCWDVALATIILPSRVILRLLLACLPAPRSPTRLLALIMLSCP
eukprot:COSAG01_NODE_443_length_17009_cov_20.575163_10_plen_187_part_00